VVRPDEDLDSAIWRFRWLCDDFGLHDSLRRIQHYIKPFDVRRNKERRKSFGRRISGFHKQWIANMRAWEVKRQKKMR